MKRRNSSLMKTIPPPPTSAKKGDESSGARGASLVPSSSRLDASSTQSAVLSNQQDVDHNDRYNYALLIALYTLQGIPMGLSASIPFLIQQKIKYIASVAAVIGWRLDCRTTLIQCKRCICSLFLAIFTQVVVGAHCRFHLLFCLWQTKVMACSCSRPRRATHDWWK